MSCPTVWQAQETNRIRVMKSKSLGVAPIVLTSFQENADVNNPLIEKFVKSTNAGEQLELLKDIIKDQKDFCDQNIAKFVAVVFYEAPSKHPVKCFLTKHITKCTNLQQLFTELLSEQILLNLKFLNDYKGCADVVPKIMTYIENFPVGAAAVKCVDVKLAPYLVKYFYWPRDEQLRNLQQIQDPSAKTDMYNLDHSVLRLLVHIIQKLEGADFEGSEDVSYWTLLKRSRKLWFCIEVLVCSDDVPMDTKCLCGILLLHYEKLTYTDDITYWEKWLAEYDNERMPEARILKPRAGQLALYSAINTLVPMEELQQPMFNADQSPAILILLNKLLSISQSEPDQAYTLAVARVLLQLSKSLEAITTKRLGVQLLELLLQFVWSHLEYHLDSVRHLSQQILAALITYCAQLEKGLDGVERDPAPLATLVESLRALGSCKSLFCGVGRLAAAVGARRVLRDLCPALHLLQAVTESHLQAAVMGAIEELLKQHAKEGDALEIFNEWVLPTVAQVEKADDSASLAVLERVLAMEARSHELVPDYIVSHMREAGGASAGAGVQCLLVGARAVAGVGALLTARHMRLASLHPAPQIRTLALSLVAEARAPSVEQLRFVLHFLRYNVGARSHSFRQLMLAGVHKVMKRLGGAGAGADEWRGRLRALCYGSLVAGAAPARRAAALRLLAATHDRCTADPWVWEEEHVDTLLAHLDDNYEANKVLALEILQHCPEELLKSARYSTRLELEAILKQASCLKPAESASAGYKLRLLLDKLPERILHGSHKYHNAYKGESEARAEFALLGLLRDRATFDRPRWGDLRYSVRRGGMFGTLHCLGAVVERAARRGVLWSDAWRQLTRDVLDTCLLVLADVEPVVSAASPEGHLPPRSPYWSSDSEEDESPVTAQMVLVCAWRSVKEASHVVASIAETFPGSGPSWNPYSQGEACETLVALLDRAQHRGALDQAAEALARLAARYWRDPRMAQVTERWVRRALEDAGSDASAAQRATRRGAGLPYIIQMLVIPELNTPGRGELFHEVMGTVLRLAAPPAAPAGPAPAPAGTEGTERRALCANILRALFRSAGAEGAVARYLGEGLSVAVRGFAATPWPERTAMSLLFSALCVRAFGVARGGRAGDAPHPRNTTPARTFFRKYPALYHLLLKILEEATSEKAGAAPAATPPSLLPALVLLSRLYPCTLEGTDTNMKLSALVPLVARCARARELSARRLAAAALRALLPTNRLVAHLESTFQTLSQRALERNWCHGLLLQLHALLTPGPAPSARLSGGAPAGCHHTLWILEQCLGPRACFPIADEYVKVVNLLVWRYPGYIEEETIVSIKICLEKILLSGALPPITTGRDLCLANCLYLYLILLYKGKNHNLIVRTTQEVVKHKSHEVVVATLNHYLMLHGKFEAESQLEEHLSSICDPLVLVKVRRSPAYIETLLNHFHGRNHLERQSKCLTLLNLEKGTQRAIIKEPDAQDYRVTRRLLEHVEYGLETGKYLYLESLLSFMEQKMANRIDSTDGFASVDASRSDKHQAIEYWRLFVCEALSVMATTWRSSSGDNSERTRAVVVSYLERSMLDIMTTHLDLLRDYQKFQYKATTLAILVTLVEDDSEQIQQRAANLAARLARPALRAATARDDTAPEDAILREVILGDEDLLPSVCGEMLRDYVETLEDNVPLFIMLALLDFNAEVCMTDDIGDECRVFDQGERYNIHLEETVWTRACARKIIELHKQDGTHLVDFVLSIIADTKYKCAFNDLCKSNVELFRKMAEGRVYERDNTINPKIELFLRMLRST